MENQEEEKISLALGKIVVSEKTAFLLSIFGFFFILGIIFLVVNLFLPKPKVKLEIIGPTNVKSGEWVTYTVKCKNIGNVILENPELGFQHPEASLPEKELIEVKKVSDFLYPREEKTFEFKTRLFGKEGEKREVKAWLNYSKKGKKMIVREVGTFSSTISEVPIDLVLDVAPKIPIYPKAESEFSFRLKYTSFLDTSISNLKLKVFFPPNFRFKEASREKEGDDWKIPTLGKGESGEIEFFGTFPAREELGKEAVFKAQLFIALPEKEVFLKEVSARSLTFEPEFSISQKVNGKENYIAWPGERLHYRISFKNIKSEPQRNRNLIVTLDGKLFDLFSIEAPLGEFTPGNNSILWTEEKVSALRYLTPGDEGEVEFWVKLKSDYRPENISEANAIIKNRVFLAGFEKEYRYKVNSIVKISQEGYYHDKYGFFQNTGPHPPRVNESTSYTIVWKIENYYNWIGDAKVRVTFPPQVKVINIKGNLTVEKEISPPAEGEKYLYPEIPADFRFEGPLQEGASSEAVRYLQIILKEEVPHAWPKNAKPTGYFGEVTKEALKAFQLKYRNEILVPQKLEKPTGYVDEFTRLKLNELLAKSVIPAGRGEIIWDVGKIEPGTGVFNPSLTAAFQIVFTPTPTQKGKVGTLVNSVTLTGVDLWTGTPVQITDEPITTLLPDDPGGIVGEGKIR